jgi:hypothetical protein
MRTLFNSLINYPIRYWLQEKVRYYGKKYYRVGTCHFLETTKYFFSKTLGEVGTVLNTLDARQAFTL